MSKSPYHPSPLRKDYLQRPLRSLLPILPQPLHKPSPPKSHQHITKYKNGILITFHHHHNTPNHSHTATTNKQQQSCIFISYKKHTCWFYTKNKGKIEGTVYVVMGNGGMLSAGYRGGVLDGWLVVYVPGDRIGCYQYSKGRKEGYQHYYEIRDRLLTTSVYCKGRLEQIHDSQHGQLKVLLNNSQLQSRIEELSSRQLQLPKVITRIHRPGLLYYGQTNNTNTYPHGYGLIFAENQQYVGEFNQGFLNGMGYILFGNGDSYWGHMSNGVANGYGELRVGGVLGWRFTRERIEEDEFRRYEQQLGGKGLWGQEMGLGEYERMWEQERGIRESQMSQPRKQSQDARSEGKEEKVESQVHVKTEVQFQTSQPSYPSQNPPIAPLTNPNTSLKVPPLRPQIKLNSQSFHKLTDNESRTERKAPKTPDFLHQTQIYNTTNNTPKNTPPPRTESTLNKPSTLILDNHIDMGTEEIIADEYYVDKEYHFMRPKNMEVKEKIKRGNLIELGEMNKNQGARIEIDYNRLLREDSEVSESRQERFMRKQFNM